jgi:uncharacterized protein (DUF2062 family)
MSKVRFKRWLLNVARLRRRQALRPLRRHVRHRALWSFDRQSVARGAPLGIFFGILTPIAQILFATIGAIVLRANVVVAAVTTLITNPFTFPFIYLWAYRLGALLTGRDNPDDELGVLAEAEDAAQAALEVQSWYPALLDWAGSVGPPVAIGVVLLACCAALIAYVLVYTLWSLGLALTGRREPPDPGS